MRNTDTFRQFIWLVNTLLRFKKCDLQQIQHRWIDEDLNNGKSLSRTTFYRMRQAIEDMFGIIIQCDSSDGNQYFINNPEVLNDNSTQNWMLQTLTVNNSLTDSLSIKNQLVLEEVPAGAEYLQTIIQAMKNHQVLDMTHKSFDASDAKTIAIQPYCLKMFRQRWYLLGKSDTFNNELRIYALDRITKLEETQLHFNMDDDFDAEAFFKPFFGVFIDKDIKTQRVVIRAYGTKMVSLMRTLPKHHSQKEIRSTTDYSDFEYYLKPTFDFCHEILKEGKDLQVMEPKSLRTTIKKELAKTLSLYE